MWVMKSCTCMWVNQWIPVATLYVSLAAGKSTTHCSSLVIASLEGELSPFGVCCPQEIVRTIVRTIAFGGIGDGRYLDYAVFEIRLHYNIATVTSRASSYCHCSQQLPRRKVEPVLRPLYIAMGRSHGRANLQGLAWVWKRSKTIILATQQL